MTDLIPFDYAGHQIRVFVLGGDPWWALADVARVLGYRDTHNASRVLREVEKGTHSVSTPGGLQAITTVSEPGLYRLIMRSRRPEAEQFQDWVVGEVLPRIRRTGSYGAVAQLPQNFAEALELAARQAREIEAARAEVAQLEPAAHSWEKLAGEDAGDYSLRDAAQILARDPAIVTGQNRLMGTLRAAGWVDAKDTPYQREVDAGRLVCRMLPYEHPHTREPRLSSQIRITVKGLHELHRQLGGERPLRLSVGA